MKSSREWEQGDTAQRRWAQLLTDIGLWVLPAYAFESVVPETKTPVMMIPGGLAITPDVLSFGPKGPIWSEVKAKSVPTWRRSHPGPRWEHGFDFSFVREYSEVEDKTRARVIIVVYETASPENDHVESDLIQNQTGKFLWIPLKLAQQIGEHRPDWPGGAANVQRRGRRDMGGLLFARSRMRSAFELLRDEPARGGE